MLARRGSCACRLARTANLEVDTLLELASRSVLRLSFIAGALATTLAGCPDFSGLTGGGDNQSASTSDASDNSASDGRVADVGDPDDGAITDASTSSDVSARDSGSDATAPPRTIRCGNAGTCSGNVCCFGSTYSANGYCSAQAFDCGADAADMTRPITCDEASDCTQAGFVCCYQWLNANPNTGQFSSASCVPRAACNTAGGTGFIACDPFAATSQCGAGQYCRMATGPVSLGSCAYIPD